MSDNSEEMAERYISEEQHKENLASQLATSPETMEQLRGFGIAEDRSVKLEYFFYTNAEEKAEALASELSGMGYVADFERSDNPKKIRIVAGASEPVQMSKERVLEWTESMCNLGYKHDCEFDGWGLNPEQ